MTDIRQRLRGKFLVGSVDDTLDPLLQEAADTIDELIAVLEKIASLRHSNSSAASIAQSALDTMKVLEE